MKPKRSQRRHVAKQKRMDRTMTHLGLNEPLVELTVEVPAHIQRRENRVNRQRRRVMMTIDRAIRLVAGNDVRMTDPIPSYKDVLRVWQILGLDPDLYDTIEGDSHPIASSNCRELRNSLFHFLWYEYKSNEYSKRFRRNFWKHFTKEEKEEFEAAGVRSVAQTRKVMGLDVEVPETV
jgi:hypothetical protein